VGVLLVEDDYLLAMALEEAVLMLGMRSLG
jgi:hypothetical protein